MADTEQPTAEQKEAIRQASLKVLKGDLPALSVSYLTSTDERHWGPAGMRIGYQLYLNYLNGDKLDGSIANLVKGTLQQSEKEAQEKGEDAYSGQVNLSSKQLVAKAHSAVFNALENVKVSDAAEILKIKFNQKWADVYVGALGAEDAPEESRQIYQIIVAAYKTNYMSKYLSEALGEHSERVKSGLEEALK